MPTPRPGLLLAAVLVLAAASPARSAGWPRQVPTVPAQGADALPPGAVARLGAVRLWQRSWVDFVALSPDGKLLASVGGKTWRMTRGGRTGTSERVVRVWDRSTGRLLRVFAPEGGVTFVAFSPDSKLLAGAGGGVWLWRVKDGREQRLAGTKSSVQWVRFANQGKDLLAGDQDGTIRLLQLGTGKEVRRWRPWPGEPPRLPNGLTSEDSTCCDLSPDGKTLAWGIRTWEISSHSAARGGPSFLRIVEPATGKTTDLDEKSPFERVLFTPDSRRLVTTHRHGVQLWDARTGKRLARIAGNASDPEVAVSPDGRQVATTVSGFATGPVVLWDAQTGKKLRRFAPPPEHTDALEKRPLAFSGDGKVLATGDRHGVRLWDVRTGREVSPWPGHRAPVTALSFSPDGRTLVSRSTATICLWDVRTWKPSARYDRWESNDPDEPHPGAVSPGGEFYLASGTQKVVVLHELGTGKPLRTFSAGRAYSRATFSPDGKVLAQRFVGRPPAVAFRQVADGRELSRLTLQKGDNDLVFAPGGRLVAWRGPGQQVGIGNVVTGWVVHRLGNPGAAREPTGVRRPELVFSPDGRYLAWVANGYGGDNGRGVGRLADQSSRRVPTSVCVWDVRRGRAASRFTIPWQEGASDQVRCLAFTADSRTLAVALEGSASVHLWEVASGKERARLNGHLGPVRSLALSPDGQFLASGSDDNTVLVWDLRFSVAGGGRSQ
jgi:WD40 repeat protein